MLIASNGLLSRRLGHTEMSVYLMQLTKLTPVALICEMLDSETYTALSVKKAKSYAQENAIAFLDGNELLEFSKVH
jgi:3,4-dihydroxy 2-butanone 4-phosphate synthase